MGHYFLAPTIQYFGFVRIFLFHFSFIRMTEPQRIQHFFPLRNQSKGPFFDFFLL